MIFAEMVAAAVEERLLVPQGREISVTVEGKACSGLYREYCWKHTFQNVWCLNHQ